MLIHHSSFLYKSTASGQEIDHGDQFGRTPLMFTILADRLECAELLLRAGANVNCKDKGGRTALHWAAHKVGPNRKEIDVHCSPKCVDSCSLNNF